MVHYIPLKKDFSNFDEVMRLYHNEQFRRWLTDNCYTDLIASGRYSYRGFIDSFDKELLALGFVPRTSQWESRLAARAIEHSLAHRVYKRITGIRRVLYYYTYPGKGIVVFVYRTYVRLSKLRRKHRCAE